MLGLCFSAYCILCHIHDVYICLSTCIVRHFNVISTWVWAFCRVAVFCIVNSVLCSHNSIFLVSMCQVCEWIILELLLQLNCYCCLVTIHLYIFVVVFCTFIRVPYKWVESCINFWITKGVYNRNKLNWTHLVHFWKWTELKWTEVHWRISV